MEVTNESLKKIMMKDNINASLPNEYLHIKWDTLVITVNKILKKSERLMNGKIN